MLAVSSSRGLGDVEPYQQTEKYSCGAATLKAVLQHWGERVPEKTLIREIDIDPETGSTALQVANAARQRGYIAQVWRFDSIAELGSYTNRDIPVIVAMRSFTRPNQGHFLVATRVKPGQVELMDPNVPGNRRTLGNREMDKRWQFRERVGVIVVPKRKRNLLGLGTTPSTSHRLAYAVTGAAALAAAAVTGILFYRRRKRSA